MQSQGMQRLVFAALIWALVALTGPSSLVAQNLGVKFPVPDEAARKQAQARLREVYGDEHAQAKSPEEKAALAAKLLSKGEQTTDDPASCFALFAAARDLAAQVGQADVAFRAIDKMGERFAFDALTAKVEAVRKLAASCTSSKQFVSLATLADELVGELSAADRFEEAAEILQTALAAAKESNNRDLLKQVQAHAKQVDAASRAYEPVKEVFALLEKKPADAEANLAAGKYLCFVKGDWDKGVSMLALGSDETLGKVARQDLEGASDAEAQAALGESGGSWRTRKRAPRKGLSRRGPATGTSRRCRNFRAWPRKRWPSGWPKSIRRNLRQLLPPVIPPGSPRASRDSIWRWPLTARARSRRLPPGNCAPTAPSPRRISRWEPGP